MPDEHSDLERLLSEHGLGAPPEGLLQGLGPILKPGGCDMVRRKIEWETPEAPEHPVLRLSEEEERMGLDLSQHNERGYA